MLDHYTTEHQIGRSGASRTLKPLILSQRGMPIPITDPTLADREGIEPPAKVLETSAAPRTRPIKLERIEGVEPSQYGLEDRRSLHGSYPHCLVPPEGFEPPSLRLKGGSLPVELQRQFLKEICMRFSFKTIWWSYSESNRARSLARRLVLPIDQPHIWFRVKDSNPQYRLRTPLPIQSERGFIWWVHLASNQDRAA